MISEHGRQVLSRGDDTTNWANFWAFLSRAWIVTQHLQGSSNIEGLKDQLLKGEDFLNVAFQANVKLVDDNKNLEDQVPALSNDAKGWETRSLSVEALVRSWDIDISKLRSALSNANKEMNEANAEKECIQQKAFDDVYNAHEVGFNHCLLQMLQMCNVLDSNVFDIDKDVHERELMLINEITEDDADLSPSRPTAPVEETPTEEAHAKDVENVEPKD